jgi:DNA-binding GntR family transcriptional regulator
MQSLARSASREAAELIRAAILDGRLQPGQRLKEEQLAREFGVSRTPVREALLFLEAEGAVVLQPNRGATVRRYTTAEIRDAYELRALLEGHAARRAAERIAPDALVALAASCARFDALRAGEVAELARENHLFHHTILTAAGSERLAAMVRGVIELPLVYKAFFWYSPEQQRLSAHHHRQLCRALEDRDAERAEMVMKEHVFEARDFLVAQLEEAERA